MNSNNIIKYLSNKDNLLFLGLAIIMLLSIYLKYNKNIEGFSGDLERLKKEKIYIKKEKQTANNSKNSVKKENKELFDKEYFVEYKKKIKAEIAQNMQLYKKHIFKYNSIMRRLEDGSIKDTKSKTNATKNMKEHNIKSRDNITSINKLMDELKILNALKV